MRIQIDKFAPFANECDQKRIVGVHRLLAGVTAQPSLYNVNASSLMSLFSDSIWTWCYS